MQRMRARGGGTYIVLLLLFVLTGCAPVMSTVTSSSFYAAPAGEVFEAAIRAISTSPGLDSDSSSRWRIIQQDTEEGRITASAATVTWNSRRRSFERATGQIVVVVAPSSSERITVEIRASERAWELAKYIVSYLDKRFAALTASSAD